jgi:hypothetical protein
MAVASTDFQHKKKKKTKDLEKVSLRKRKICIRVCENS